ncbi:MAG: DUF1127 domain-containing protein [Paracoccaceae bacterium]
MAYANTTRGVELGLGDRIGGLVKTVAESIRRRRVYAQTLRELNALSSRELEDLGIHRSMIASIAAESAYGK